MKATGFTPAINIDVMGSSNTSMKTELSSPGQPKVCMNAEVIDSSEVTEVSLLEQVPVLHMNTKVKDSTQVAFINTCVPTTLMNNSFQKQSVEVLNVDNDHEDEQTVMGKMWKVVTYEGSKK